MKDNKMSSPKRVGSFQTWVKSLNSLNPSTSTKLAKREENTFESILIFQLYSEQGAFHLVIQLLLKSSVKLRKEDSAHFSVVVQFELKFETVYIVQLN